MATNTEVVEMWDKVTTDLPEPKDNESSKSNQDSTAGPSCGGQSFKLALVVENLILLGMTSLGMWDRVLTSMKTHTEIVMNTECVSLYFVLKQLYNALSSKIYADGDLSQEKLPLITNNELSYEEIMQILNPILKKKAHKDRTFSLTCVQKITNLARKIIQDILSPTSDKKRTKSKQTKNAKKAKKDTEDVSMDKEECSSSYSTASSVCSSTASSSTDDDSSEDDEFDKIFKKNTKKQRKTKSVVIKQLFQYRKPKSIQKIITPGEEGKYLIKIELTDTKDLKECSDPTSYWQKISKKAYFLTEKKNPKYKATNDLLKTVAKELSEIEGVNCEKKKISKNRVPWNRN